MTYLAHLPGFCLTPGATSYELDAGAVTHVPWEEWRSLDDSFPFQDRRYEDARPLFLVVEDDDVEDQDIQVFMTGTAALVHHALVVCNPVCSRVAPPVMSMGYHRQEGGLVVRTVGPLEREAVLWGLRFEATDPLTEERMVSVRLVVRVLAAIPRPSGVSILLDALGVTGRPDIDHATGLVTCVAAVEAALMPDETSDLRSTFARRVASLVTTEPDRFAVNEEYASLMYRLRSELVHGGVRMSTLEALGIPTVEYVDATIGRNLLRPVLIRLAALLVGGATHEELIGLLDDAATDSDVLSALDARVDQEMLRHG